MAIEVTLNSKCNIQKLVIDKQIAIYKDKEYKYKIADGKIISIRKNGVKEYSSKEIPNITDYLPNIVLNNYKQHLFARYNESKEWYFAFKTKDDFENVYKSLKIDIPKGTHYDNFNNNLEYYSSYHNYGKEWKYGLSVEIIKNNVILHWYYYTNLNEYEKLIMELKNEN